MSLFRPSSDAKPIPQQGRPGTIRAVVAGVGIVLLGVVTVSGLRMATAENDTQTAQTASTDAYAMAQLVAPPAPDTFGVTAQTPLQAETPLVLATGTTPSEPDCVKKLEQSLAPVAVSFDQGSSDVDAQNAALLSRISEEIMDCDAAYVMVAGHADGSGEDAVNLALSWERADRTLNTLLMLGVDPFAVEAMGFGARAPLSQGSDEEDTADRRVDFRVMRKP